MPAQRKTVAIWRFDSIFNTCHDEASVPRSLARRFTGGGQSATVLQSWAGTQSPAVGLSGFHVFIG